MKAKSSRANSSSQNKNQQLVAKILLEQGFVDFQLSEYSINQWQGVNFLTELDGLNRIEHQPNTFNFARKELFNSFCWLLIDEQSCSDYKKIHTQGMELIHQAAQLMYKIDGDRGMRDPLVWLFIPKGWQQSTIDRGFDGVGDWRA